MNKQEAIEVLMALACCSLAGLTCEDCPRAVSVEDEDVIFGEDTCHSWSDDEVVEAVRVLREGDHPK